jgi:hypothetical protein
VFKFFMTGALVTLAMSIHTSGQGVKREVTKPTGYSLNDSIKGVKSIRPKQGFVPDETTALKIAEAVLLPVYGEKQIATERPLNATLTGDVWTVHGTIPITSMGGTAIVKISKRTGAILFMHHQQ